MAFDFLGTLSLEQLRDLRAFLQEEIQDIDEQINTLRVELDNTKTTRIEFIEADSRFGGDVMASIYETELPKIRRVPKQDDTNSAILVQKAKKPFISNIKYKRERIEFKVKKLTDLIEQIREMIDRKAIAKDQTIELLNEVEKLFNEENSNHLFKTTEELNNFFQGIG